MIGPTKITPSYDQLNQTQWVTGCLKAALDLPQPDRYLKLEYLTNLMEDATDFCFESAKACHALVLTTMELGKIAWHETGKLHRCRRTDAQRHLNVFQSAKNVIPDPGF